MNDIHVEAMHEAHALAVREADVKMKQAENTLDAVKKEAFALGVLQKINYDNAHNELVKYVMMYQIRQEKEYKAGGMTWDQFCEASGEQRRSVDNKLKDIRPFVEGFSEKFSGLLKVPFSKIRYLGRSLSENFSGIKNGALVIDNNTIPLAPENQEEIEAAIDTLIETHKNEKKTLKQELGRYKKQTDQIVAEETKALTHERDALIREVDRLKPFDVSAKDRDWCKEQFSEVTRAMAGLSAASHPLLMDDRMDGDRTLQAEAYKYIIEAEGILEDLRNLWVDRFSGDE